MIFCDTSFSAHLYVSTPETAAVRRILEGPDQPCMSELARPELLAIFHRRLYTGRWTSAQFSAAAQQFRQDDLAGFWTWFPISPEIAAAAGETYASLPTDAMLRPTDCIHLVTALHHNFEHIQTFDRHQIVNARLLGLSAHSIRVAPNADPR